MIAAPAPEVEPSRDEEDEDHTDDRREELDLDRGEDKADAPDCELAHEVDDHGPSEFNHLGNDGLEVRPKGHRIGHDA